MTVLYIVPMNNFDLNSSPLVSAAKKGNLAEVQKRLKEGRDPDEKSFNERTSLIYAAQEGYYDVAATLLAAGADVNAESIVKMTPLMYAAQYEHIDMMKLLLKHGGIPRYHGVHFMNLIDDNKAKKAMKKYYKPVNKAYLEKLYNQIFLNIPCMPEEVVRIVVTFFA